MKPFDIEKAKAGAAVVDAKGNAVQVLTYTADITNRKTGVRFPVVALIQNPKGCVHDNSARTFDENGRHINGLYNLYMKPIKKSYWLNCYADGCTVPHYSKEDADLCTANRVACIEVAWEE